MIPFGDIESPPGSIAWPPDQAIRMNVLGFQDAWDNALTVQVSPNLTIHFISLPGWRFLS